MRFTRAQEDFRRGLREHGFGVVTVPRLELAAPLETHDYRVVRFPVFGDGRVQLWESLQARELVQHEHVGCGRGCP
jgi:hypothetical protein